MLIPIYKVLPYFVIILQDIIEADDCIPSKKHRSDNSLNQGKETDAMVPSLNTSATVVPSSATVDTTPATTAVLSSATVDTTQATTMVPFSTTVDTTPATVVTSSATVDTTPAATVVPIPTERVENASSKEERQEKDSLSQSRKRRREDDIINEVDNNDEGKDIARSGNKSAKLDPPNSSTGTPSHHGGCMHLALNCSCRSSR